MTGATPVWVGRDIRLDPDVLPARWSVPTGAGTGADADAAVYLDGAGVVVKRRLSGLPLTLALPLTAYLGVAVRVTPDEADGLVASVELLHADPDLTLPLLVTRDMEEAALDWERWSSRLRLPLLMIEPDGSVERIVRPARVPIGTPSPRRRRAALARRPRFLVRRKPGHGRPTEVLRNFREIAGWE